MKYYTIKDNIKRSMLLLCFLTFNIIISQANNDGLYNVKSQESAASNGLYTEEQPQVTNENSSSGLFSEDEETLYAPPGGGAPIGGVPVENGYLILILLASGYFIQKGYKHRKLNNK